MTPKQIKDLRASLNLTQQQLADIIGAQRVTVARWETGANVPRGVYRRMLEFLAKTKKTRSAETKSLNQFITGGGDFVIVHQKPKARKRIKNSKQKGGSRHAGK